MARKRFSPEQVINLLRKAEVLMNQGAKSREVCRQLEILQQTYCRWRKEYGRMRVDQAGRSKRQYLEYTFFN